MVSVLGTGKIYICAKSKKEAIKKLEKVVLKEVKKFGEWKGLVGVELVKSYSKNKKEGIKFDKIQVSER